MNTKQIHIPDWKEKRRYRALELKRADWTHEDNADALGISTRAVIERRINRVTLCA